MHILKYGSEWKAINPAINIHITTNGTVLNTRVKELLEGMRCGIVLSLDSLHPDTYAQIRLKGQLARVLQNMDYFLDYTQRKQTYFSIAVCPMQINCSEMPALVDFANEKNVSIHFNTVWNPEEVSLRFLRASELEQVLALYEQYKPVLKTNLHRENYARFTELTEQIKTWRNERAAMPEHLQDIHWAVNFNELSVDAVNALPETTKSIVKIQLRALIKAQEHPLLLNCICPPI
ncbi:MAG: hypothetical protein IPN29_02150 [Saprospiraceae bacterium]|nr:hypothetical protein [Saprospiraceae bacterium]